MLRYLNMFVLIGIALILISCVGFATGNKFLTEPGQTPNPNASLVYLGAGVLMLFNGYLSIIQAPPQAARPPKGENSEEPRSDSPVSAEAETV
jgi:hypothetical protein